ncbi:hypothetical protein BDV09DRAFT_167679 [Aspergillus tetrazonus]
MYRSTSLSLGPLSIKICLCCFRSCQLGAAQHVPRHRHVLIFVLIIILIYFALRIIQIPYGN